MSCWRLRVKNDATTLMLTGKTWPETAQLLHKRYERVLLRLDKISAEDVFDALMNATAPPTIRTRTISRRAARRNIAFR